MTITQSSKAQAVIERHDQHMTINFARYPLVMDRGEGCRVFDVDGKEYLDLFAGFGAGLMGHCHPDLVAAAQRQINKLWHVGNLFHTEPQTLLAEAIARHGFGGRSFFCHSGADANEAAFKLARLFGREHPGTNGPRFKIISTTHSFHGRTFATMMATGQEKVRHGYDPYMPGFVNVPYNDLNAIKTAADEQTVAVIVEPMQGEGGVVIPDDDYLPKLRDLCDERNMLLICDEVWTGCGRTGRYFAHQHWGIEPDMMTLAKGVGGGLAVGVMCAKPKVAEYFNWRNYGGVAHATTLGGNCVSMAVAAAVLTVVERDGLVEHAAELGEIAIQELRQFAKNHPAIKSVRGKGLFIGIELDPSAKDVWFKNAGAVVAKCMEQGVLINATQETVLRLAPPLIISREELVEGLEILKNVIEG